MASVAKFKLPDTPRLLSHCNRTQQKLGTHIDQNRTNLNYNLSDRAHPEQTDYQFAKSRIHQDGVRMLNRPNVNAVCSWVVTLPKELCHEVTGENGESYFTPNDPDECQEFFRHAYDFFSKQHGKENSISSYVHMDENMPHMHYIFTPIVKDQKHGCLKVSAKEALADCYGVEFQIKLQDYISKNMGKELHMVRKDNVDYERNVKQLKKQTLNAHCASLSKQIKKAQEELDRKKRSLRVLDKTAEAMNVDVKTTSSNGYTVMKDSEWAMIQAQIKTLKALRAERQALRKELEELEHSNFSMENQKLIEENEKLRRQNETYARENESLRLEVADMREFLESTKIHGRSALEIYGKNRGSVREETERD